MSGFATISIASWTMMSYAAAELSIKVRLTNFPSGRLLRP